MYNFCTYFDSNYVFQGLALYDSLRRNCSDLKLYVCCLDERVHEILTQLDAPGLTPFKLSEVEEFDPEFAATKTTRNIVEYYFTMSPVLPLYLFDKYPEIEMITYLDSDLLFYADPKPVFDEMGKASLLLIEHRFPPELQFREKFGLYNLQFQPYRRDENTMNCLRWWREQCIEWCYDRLENNKFADQKYLEQWPEKFAGVHILQHKGAGLAPWNWSQYDIRLKDGKLTVDGQALIFYHFQGFRILSGGFINHNLGSYGHIMNKEMLEFFYENYYYKIIKAENSLRNIPAANDLSIKSKLQRTGFSRLRGYLSAVKNRNFMKVNGLNNQTNIPAKSPRHSWLKKLRWTVLALIMIFIIFTMIIEYLFANPGKAFYSGEKRVWGHRGYVKNCPENTVESFKKAFDAGAAGTEMDINYDVKTGNYYVAHENPLESKSESIKLLSLEDVLKAVGKRGYFWLDFKNFAGLSRNDALKASKDLKTLLDKYNMGSKAIVESTDFDNLSIASSVGLYVVQWRGAPSTRNPISFHFKQYGYKIRFILNGISAISCDYRSLRDMREAYPHVPLFLFTANNKQVIKGLLQDEKVIVILTDKPYYNIKPIK